MSQEMSDASKPAHESGTKHRNATKSKWRTWIWGIALVVMFMGSVTLVKNLWTSAGSDSWFSSSSPDKPRTLKNLSKEVGGTDPFHIKVGEVLEMHIPAPPMNGGWAGASRCPVTTSGTEGFQITRISGSWVRFRLSADTTARMVAVGANTVQGTLVHMHLRPGQVCPHNPIALP